MNKNNQVDLGITDKQKEKGNIIAKRLDLSLGEYIRRATDAYSTILTQNDLKLTK